MAVKLEEVELGKTYQLNNGSTRRILEIIPDGVRKRQDEASDEDIVRFEAEKWGYDPGRHGGHTRVKVKVREKQKRCDFAKEVIKRLD